MTQPPSFVPRHRSRKPTSSDAKRVGTSPSPENEAHPRQATPPQPRPAPPTFPPVQPAARRRSILPQQEPQQAPPAGSMPPGPPAQTAPGARPVSYAPRRVKPREQVFVPGPPSTPAQHPAAASSAVGRGALPPLTPAQQPRPMPAPLPGRKRHYGRRVLAFLLAVLVSLVGWVAFLITDANRHFARAQALAQTSSADGTTYLVAGSDSRADGAVQDSTEGQRADSIMVINVAPNGQASAISIPRDSYVEIPNYGWSKINASYAVGGDGLLVATVNQLTGLTVDHYVEVGMGGVGNIVDAVGGVNLCYDQTVNDSYSGLNWQSGCHDVDGKTALAFSRMRHSDPLGDIGRAERQRQVVTKAISAALSPTTLLNPLSAYRLERAGSGALTIDQDSSVLDIAQLALAFRTASAEQLTGAPPIDSLGYATDAGSAVLLHDTTAPDFFAKVRSGTLSASDFTTPGQ